MCQFEASSIRKNEIMNLDSHSLALSQVTNLVGNLSKKSYKQSVAEISRLVSQQGPEGDRHLLRCLFSYVDFSGDGKTAAKEFHQLHIQLLTQECTTLFTKPNFVCTLCHALDNPLHQQKSLKPSTQLFSQISKVLKLSRVQEVVLGLALTHSSKADTRSHALQFVKHKLPDLLRSYIDSDIRSPQEGGLADVSAEVLHLLLTHLLHSSKDQLGIVAPQREAFLKTIKKDFPPDQVPVVLVPLLYSDTQDIGMDRIVNDNTNLPKAVMDGSLADMMQEMGYSCCATMDECRKSLLQFGTNSLSASAVARVISMMARTHSSLTDSMPLQSITGSSVWSDGKDKADPNSQPSTWNVDVFVEVIKDLAPHLNFREVIPELDNPGFLLTDVQGLRIVKNAFLRGLPDVFPVEVLHRVWKNTDGQLSWIQLALANPEVFCFADYPCHTVVIDILKTQPEEDNREVATWKSLDLVETLLKLAEAGKYDQVKSLFGFPIKHCPDMLLLALLQVQVCFRSLPLNPGMQFFSWTSDFLFLFF